MTFHSPMVERRFRRRHQRRFLERLRGPFGKRRRRQAVKAQHAALWRRIGWMFTSTETDR